MATPNRRNWFSRGLLSLVVLAALAFTVHSVAFSGASFTARSANAPSILVVGELSHTNDAAGQIVLDAAGLMPGISSSESMTLKNTGTVAGTFSLAAATLNNDPATPKLSDVLVLTVRDISADTNLYSGSVTAFSTASLGTLAPGATRSYELKVAYPSGSNQASLQGATMTLGLQITGVSQ